MSDYNSPRSYKKKSGLAKLAASRGHRKVASSEESDEVDSYARSSHYGSRSRDELADSLHRQSLRSPRYPIDADVEVRDSSRSRGYSRGAMEDDSDEGIELNNSGRYGTSSHSRSTNNDGTINRLKSLNVDTLDSQESETENYGRSYQSSSYKGEKRYRDQNSDGDDMARDLGRSRNRKQLVGTGTLDSDDQDIIDSMPTHHRYSRTSSTGKTSPLRSHSPDRSPSRLDRYSNMDVDKLGNSSSDELGGTYSRAKSDDESDLYDRYRQILSKENGKNNKKSYSSSSGYRNILEEDNELEDNVPDLRRKVLTQNARSVYPARAGSPLPSLQKKDTIGSVHSNSSVSSSLFRSLGDRQWSMASAPHADDVSQRSFQSSSVLPLISTKQARNR